MKLILKIWRTKKTPSGLKSGFALIPVDGILLTMSFLENVGLY